MCIFISTSSIVVVHVYIYFILFNSDTINYNMKDTTREFYNYKIT